MAFDNQLGKGKDWRKPYYDCRAFDWSCRHGGSCTWCEGRRTFKNKRREPIIDYADFRPFIYFRGLR